MMVLTLEPGQGGRDHPPGATADLLPTLQRVCFGLGAGAVSLLAAVGIGASWVRTRSLPLVALDPLVRAHELESAGDLSRALAEYRRAAVVHGGAGYASTYGQALLKSGQLKMAEVWFRTASRLDPSLAAAYSGLGEIALEENRFDDAVRWFERGLLFAPKNAGLLNEVGVAHALAKRFPEAISAFEEAVKLGGGAGVAENLARARRDAAEVAGVR